MLELSLSKYSITLQSLLFSCRHFIQVLPTFQLLDYINIYSEYKKNSIIFNKHNKNINDIKNKYETA